MVSLMENFCCDARTGRKPNLPVSLRCFGEVSGYTHIMRRTSTEGFTFISPCCFGHLIKKGHKIVDSQLQSQYKKKKTTLYRCQLKHIYTYCT